MQQDSAADADQIHHYVQYLFACVLFVCAPARAAVSVTTKSENTAFLLSSAAVCGVYMWCGT
jgi:hypothetical protein